MIFRSLLVLAILAPSVVSAADWPNWRGPNFDGVAEGAGYPVEWSSSKNVVWKAELPGPGSSTPAILGDKIFVTTGSGDGTNLLVCLRRDDGKALWSLPLGKERPGKNRKASGANSSPVTDGKHVFAYFKSGDLACTDLDGKMLWKKNLQEEFGEDTLWWDLGTSPVVTKDFVVVACMQTGPSYVAAFEKATGKLAWKHDRMLDAPVEAAQSYTTPIVIQAGDEERILVLGADHVTSHRADNGKEIWRVGGLNPTQHKYFRSISSPVVAGELLIAPYARGATLTAIRLGGKGDVTDSHVAWVEEGPSADVPTPIAFEGRVYICKDKGQLFCLNAKTGKEIWKYQAPMNRNAYSSSPILADGRLYLTREDGVTVVVDARQSEPKLVAENELDGEITVATPVLVDGRVFIRTETAIYCFGTSAE